MNVFVIGDTHLSLSENVAKPMDIYGGVWENHSERLKKIWEQLVGEEDVVILAGDISWALKFEDAMTDLSWISKLKGKKVLFKGNHDLWWTSINKLNKLFDNMQFIQNSFYEAGDIAICGSRGWMCPGSEHFEDKDMKIYKREVLRLENSLKLAKDRGFEKIIGILHYPPTNEKKQASEFTRLFEEYGVKKVYYGHLHNEDAKRNREAFNFNGVSYKLISFDAVEGVPFKINLDCL